jgi:hypothetical protein
MSRSERARQIEEDRYRLDLFQRHEAAIRALERRRIAALVGPGHNYGLACDAPADSDPRYDATGFSDGLI